MTQGRHGRNERVLVIAATALGVVTVFGVINATAGVVGRDAMRPVGPRPTQMRVAAPSRSEVLYASGPKLPPPLPGTRPATAPPLPPLAAALYQPSSGIDVYVEKPPPAPRDEPTRYAIRYAAPQRLRAPRDEALSSTPPPLQPSGAREPDVAAANAAAVQNGPPELPTYAPAAQNPAASAGASGAAAPAPHEQVATAAAAAAREPAVEDARVLRAVEPVFPDEIRGSLSGPVSATVIITLGPGGSVLGTRIERSTGYPVLDQAAQEAARESRYTPARIDGKPAASTFRAVYDFSP